MANGDDKTQQQTDPGVWKKDPDGVTRWYTSDTTKDQAHLATQTPDDKTDQHGAVSKGWSWLWKPKVSPEAVTKFWATSLYGTSEPPSRSDPRYLEKRVIPETLGQVSSSLTAPGSLALSVLSFGDYTLEQGGFKATTLLGRLLRPALLKGPGYATAAYFGVQGLAAMRAPKQEGEDDADVLERQLLGGAAFIGTLHGIGGDLREGVGKMLVSSFGLNEDLAGKVATRVEAMERIRGQKEGNIAALEADRDVTLSRYDTATRRRIAALEDKLDQDQYNAGLMGQQRAMNFENLAGRAIEDSKGRISDLQRQQLVAGSRIMSETAMAIRELGGDPAHGYEGTLQKPFREIGDTIKEPLTSKANVRTMIENEFRRRSINPEELPRSATRALGVNEGQDVFIDTAGGIKRLDIEGQGDLTFNQITRIREDLWQTGDAAKDANVGGALKAVQDQLTDLQEQVAEKHGKGAEYRKAKDDWRNFKRSLDDPTVKKWIEGDTASTTETVSKVSKLIQTDDATSKGQTTRIIRGVLKQAGIDTGPLDDLAKQIEAEKRLQGGVGASAKALTRQSGQEASASKLRLKEGTQKAIDRERGLSKEQAEDIRKQYDKRIAEAEETARLQGREEGGERHAIIPNFETKELAGKSQEELYRIRLNEMAQRQGGGLHAAVIPIVMTTYGLLHASMFPFLYGAARGGLPEMVKNPAFQDYLIKRSGVRLGTPEANRLRRAYANLSPILRRLERSGVPQTALRLGRKERELRVTAEPPKREDFQEQPQP